MRIEVKHLEQPERIAKYLAQNGFVSRRKAEELISKGHIKLDGIVLKEQGVKVTSGNIIEIVEFRHESVSILLNKPIGFVSAQAQNGEIPSIVLATPENNCDARKTDYSMLKIPALGRLDKDSHGLLILSNDGVLAKNVISQESDTEKEYIVKVKGSINNEKICKLRFGLSLDGRNLKRAVVNKTDENTLQFILKEGRNRQIRRMCSMLGLEVLDLQRIRIGEICLNDLDLGKWRHLTAQEINSFKPFG